MFSTGQDFLPKHIRIQVISGFNYQQICNMSFCLDFTLGAYSMFTSKCFLFTTGTLKCVSRWESLALVFSWAL